jgi:putative membrane protein
MAREKTYAFLAALPICFAAACSKPTNPPPQTAADQTTITGAAENASPSAASNDDGTEPNSTSRESAPSPNDSMAGTTAGSASPVPGTPSAQGAPSAGAAAAGADRRPADLSDGEIAAVVQAADHGEIDQAREALRKAKSDRVKEFARHMITDHSAAERKLASVDAKASITPKESAASAQLKSGGEETLESLRSSSNEDFDKAYMDAQVRQHTEVLALLDDELIPHAQNTDLLKALREVRAKVAGHLKMAQDVQATLAGSK